MKFKDPKMSTVKRIYKNIIFLSCAEVISIVLRFFLMVYAARILDKESFGKFNFAVSLSFIAIVVADFGINTLLIREISRNKESVGKYFKNSMVIKLFMSLLIFFVLVAYINLMSYPQSTKDVVYMIWIFSLISTFTELFYSVFRAFENMFFDSIIKIMRMIILTTIGIYALLRYENVLIFSAAFVVTEALVLLMAYGIASKRFYVNRGKIELKFIIKILKCAFPFLLSFVFSTIYFYISSVMLSKIKGDVEVASFSAAYNIILAILFIPGVYGNAIYPVMSRYFKSSKRDLKVVYARSFKYLMILGFPVSAGVYFLSKDMMGFFYGEKYIGSYIALQIISLYLLIKFLNTLMGFLLSSINRQGYRVFSQGITALIIVILNLILIPKKGYPGAAIATLLAEVILFAMYYFYSSKFLCAYNPFPVLWKTLLATLWMAFVINHLEFGLIFKVLAGGISYFTVIILLRIFDFEDIAIIKKILKRDSL